MGRIRSIKPDFFPHEELSLLPAETHLLAAGLLVYADDFGYFNANPALVKAAIFPVRELLQSVPEMLGQLLRVGYIRLGNLSGAFASGSVERRYGQVVNFDAHQRVSHPTPSKIKALAIDWVAYGEIREDAVKPPETFVPEGKGMERKGREGEERTAPPAQSESEIPEGLAAEQYAHGLIEKIPLPVSVGLMNVVSQAVKITAQQEQISLATATGRILERAQAARERGEKVNRFWFDDGLFGAKSLESKSDIATKNFLRQRAAEGKL